VSGERQKAEENGVVTCKRAPSAMRVLQTSIAGLSRVSLVSALKANPNTVIILPSRVLNRLLTMLVEEVGTRIGAQVHGRCMWRRTSLKSAVSAHH
jgi:hypothetical protein